MKPSERKIKMASQTHRCKRIEAGHYEYRGHSIVSGWSDGYGVSWYVNALEGESDFDPMQTLAGAKEIIDYYAETA